MLAVKVIEYTPALPGSGVPLRTPPLKPTPAGKAPFSMIVGVGDPVAVTVNAPPAAVTNVVLFALLMAGAEPPVAV